MKYFRCTKYFRHMYVIEYEFNYHKLQKIFNTKICDAKIFAKLLNTKAFECRYVSKLCMVCLENEDASLLLCHTDILVAWIPTDYFNRSKCIETKRQSILIHLTYGTTVHREKPCCYVHVYIHTCTHI